MLSLRRENPRLPQLPALPGASSWWELGTEGLGVGVTGSTSRHPSTLAGAPVPRDRGPFICRTLQVEQVGAFRGTGAERRGPCTCPGVQEIVHQSRGAGDRPQFQGRRRSCTGPGVQDPGAGAELRSPSPAGTRSSGRMSAVVRRVPSLTRVRSSAGVERSASWWGFARGGSGGAGGCTAGSLAPPGPRLPPARGLRCPRPWGPKAVAASPGHAEERVRSAPGVHPPPAPGRLPAPGGAGRGGLRLRAARPRVPMATAPRGRADAVPVRRRVPGRVFVAPARRRPVASRRGRERGRSTAAHWPGREDPAAVPGSWFGCVQKPDMSSWNLAERSRARYRRHFLVDNSAFHVERCMSVMQSGTQMIKLKRGAKGLVRLFYLDEHRTRLRWRPSRKSEKAKILIDSIYKVTEGRQSEIFHRQAEGNFDPSCCFTIYHGNHMESLDLITSNPEEARTWITGLKYLMAGISDEDSLAKRQRTHDQWLKQTFEEADKNGDGLLNIEEIHQLMHKLNVNLPRRKVRQMFQEADTDENQGTLTFEEFCVFYKMMSLRRDLYLLLLSYSDKKDHLTVEELAQFLKVEQKMNNVTTDYCLDIIRKFEVSEENKAKNVLGIEGFTSFMRSPACDVFNPLHHEVFQDMEQPLCNYYIASSHNTYLTGDQLLSQSRADMYARVLQEGCRCVEVDCWDGPDGEPVVHHGYTLTSKILFRDVVETINKHAFVKNEFPVILSIENHCSVQQQRKIAQYLKAIFRDKLDLSSVDTGDSKQLPSPQSLRGKILVKGKKLPYHLGDDAEEGDVSDEDSADEIEDECKFRLHCNNGTTEHQVESFIRKKLESLLKESQIRDKEDPDSFTVRALLKATHEGLNAHLTQHPDVKESGKKSHGRSLMTNFGKYKQKTTKSRSKSYGTDDEEDAQQPPSKEPSPLSRLGRRRKTMKLCRELSDLVVYTNSVAAQDIMDDGFNPMWEETLTFTVHMPEIALVRFLVWDHDPIGRDFVGQRTVTFSSLVPGYRHVYLEGLTEASIFVHITINDICGKWSPLILNPSYTILHFLGATKSRQLQGLKGLFHKNPRLAASDSNPHSMRKRSLGDRILRRTASAPAKGRKKSKTGFQEMVEIKDSVCEPAREPDGVLRRTARSLQARPVSMPVGRTLLGAWPPAPTVTEAAEGKESPPAGKDGARDGAAGMKDPRLPNFSKKLSSSSSALLPKDVGLRDSPVSTANMLVPGGQWAAPGPAGGRARSHVAGDCQEHQSPSKSLSPRQHWAPDPAPDPTRDPCAVRFKEHVDARIPAEGRSLLSQSSLEIKALGGTWDPGRAAASFSLSDISALCADAPDLHSTAILQESEISRLIDDVTLTNENEPGSSISALIGQFEETSDQASLTVVAHLNSTRVRPGRPPLPAADLEMPVKCGFPTGKPESPFLSSPPALLPSSSPETCERSARPGVCETTCTLAWKTKLDDAPPGKAKTRAVEGNLPRSSSTSHCWGPKSPAPGEALETVQARSLAPAADLTLEGVIADPTLCFNSAESSLVELDGDSENLSVTACESRREGTSHIASPLKLKYSQDAVGHFQRGLRNGYCKETLRPPVPEIFSSIQDVRNQGVSCLARQGAGSVYDHFSNSEAKTNPTCVPLSSAPDVHAPAPPWSTRAPLPAMKLPSPCKSKSLGDLTSEDIACSFESTYQCISKSFVATGAREEEGVRVPTASLEPADALTQQLRRLVSFDQDDGCPASCSQQDTGQVPRVLVRKLSSRSQSRVRNIASRARERQEAGRPRGADPSAAGGVVLRTKRAAPAPAGTRHSTGSYVAHLHLPGAHLPGAHLPGGNGRGPPEGACACAALRSRRTHRFGSDDSFVHTEPSSDDKPEIYFLLRL
ncbi:1-phosphatidylinositol 4,5-bisphosphate phosphodiesterase eta-1 isoform X9 [Equus asinus]|uniref:1-phosphatidylinositol 4,5-bisphosphate phosphodiesterase eta-1 isoform X9 n=1 Tax=Equus asinus TaxID=9793 RepID=UPI0038F79C97